ncbi:MAG: histidine phosphatase family protein [Proteobacteria bacterium]|nr:histidine phosphatase family protein [Pseudomonadota bacterium]
MFKFSNSKTLANVKIIWTSKERKAIETAQILSKKLNIDINFSQELGENDRSSTGFLPPAEFEKMANLFFQNPKQSIRGWETAKSTQKRITSIFSKIKQKSIKTNGDIAIISHGAVGTLLYCAINNLDIDRIHDQPKQGSYWTYCPLGKKTLHSWKSIS